MISQSLSRVSHSFLAEINHSSQNDILAIVDAKAVLTAMMPRYSSVVGATLELSLLQANYYLPSLHKNPVPEIDDLSPEIKQTAEIISHKEKYNPVTGHAIEISFYKDFGDGSWKKMARDYLYNLGETEQYLPLLHPYFAADNSQVFLGQNERLGMKISLGNLAASDYLVIHGSIKGEVNSIFLADFPTQYNHLSGTVGGDTFEATGAKKRNYLLITNYGPGRLFLAFGNSSAATSKNTAWIDVNNSLLFEGGHISYAGNSPQIEFLKGAVVPDTSIFFSSDSSSNFGLIESYFT